MKKWLLISAILNILILQIPLSKNNKVSKIKENINFDLTRINFKTNNKLKKSQIYYPDNNMSYEVKKNDDKLMESIKNIDYNRVDINTPNIKEDTISNKKSEDIIYTEKLINPIESNREVPKEVSNTFVDSNSLSSENSKIESSNANNKTSETQKVIEKDENILSNGSVKLVKENSGLNYTIIKSVNPIYPKKAQILNLKENVKIFAEFTVDTKGDIKDISLSSDFSKYKQYDFDKAIEKALNLYKFSNIIYKNQIVEVRFRKVFEFNIN